MFLSLSSINPIGTQNITDLNDLLQHLNNNSLNTSFSLSQPILVNTKTQRLKTNLLLKIVDCQDISTMETTGGLKEKDRTLAFVLDTIDGSQKFRAFEYKRLSVLDELESEAKLKSSYLLVKKETILKRDTLFLEPDKTAVLNENSKLEQLIQFLEYK